VFRVSSDREQTRREALNEQIAKNVRILKLAREDPGWALARILRAEELEAELKQAERDRDIARRLTILAERERDGWEDLHRKEQELRIEAERQRDEVVRGS
jgi:hypothetical protein